MSVIHEEEFPDFSDANTWQANQCCSALLSLARKAYDQGHNALVTVKSYAGVPISKDGHIFEFLASGIPAMVTSEDEVTIPAPPKPMIPNKVQPQAEKPGDEHDLPKKKPPQKRPRQKGIYLDDVSWCPIDKQNGN